MVTRYAHAQQWFDDAVAYFATMQRPCGTYDPNEEFVCLYEFQDERCIIGQFIPEGHPALTARNEQGKIPGVGWLLDEYPELHGVCVPEDSYPVTLGVRIQSIHDRHDNWDETGFIGWGQLAEMAAEHGLIFTKPNMSVPEVKVATTV